MYSAAVKTVVATTVIGTLTACSIPEKQLVSGLGEPFGCLGDALRTTTETEPVKIAGTLVDPFMASPVAGAAVEAFLVGTSSPIFTTTSDANGAFSRQQGFGGMPRNAFLRASPNGYLPSYFYPAVPIAGDVNLAIQMLAAEELATITMIAGINQLDPGKTNLFVSVIDCNGAPVEGATVATTPAGTVRYFADKMPSQTSIATDAITGSALIANIPVSNTTISATVNGLTLRSHKFDGVAGALMQIEIQP
jgi:hypothetical protein